MKNKIWKNYVVPLLSILAFGAALMVPLTTVDEPIRASLSAYHNAPNRTWYYLFHIFIILTYFLRNALYKRPLYAGVAFASGLTWALDMFEFNIPHAITTASIVILAGMSSLIYAYDDDHLTANTACISIGVLAFVLGVFTSLFGPSGVLIGELIMIVAVIVTVILDTINMNINFKKLY